MKFDFVDVFCYVILFLFFVVFVLACIDAIERVKAPRFHGVVVKQYTDKVAVKVAYDYQHKGDVYSDVRTYYVTSEEYASLSVGDLVDFDVNNRLIVDSKKGE